MLNAVKREIPASIDGYKEVVAYAGPFSRQPQGRKASPLLKAVYPGHNKLLNSIEEAIDASGLKSGMTISFHHALRNGDRVMNMVVDAIARRGIDSITIAPSSFLDTNEHLIPHFESGVLIAAETSGLRGKLGQYLTLNKLQKPTILRPHGGRIRALECGELKIDVAFLAAPTCDTYGNINGVDGPTACGSLGYAMVDARMADVVVAITDHLVEYPLCPISIPQYHVDFIVQVDCIGDSKGIASGSLRGGSNPRDIQIARYAATVMEFAGYFKNGMGMQLGAGAASVGAAAFLKEKMLRDSIKANFVMGGIPAPFCELLREGLIGTILDTQTFDRLAIQSLKDNPRHQEVDCGFYANPWSKGATVNLLDYVVLGATEVDLDFNVNVITDSNGIMMGAVGGHTDTAAGAKCSIVVAPLIRGRLPMVTDRVQTVCTPGETVDVIVTERGVAVNPRRQDLIDNLKSTGLPLMSIEQLKDLAYSLTGAPDPIELTDEIMAVVEYRDGSLIDIIRKPLVVNR